MEEFPFLQDQLPVPEYIAAHDEKITPRETPLYIARPLLPPLEDLMPLLNQIWEAGYVTNSGPLSRQLEDRLADFLDTPTTMVFNNGTTALMAALKLFDLPPGSEVITTPFTFAATSHAICWNSLTPVFADVLPGSYTIDPAAVSRAVTKRTSAILGVHVYGNICELDELQAVAGKAGVPLIYDAAHAFGVKVGADPIGCFGDATAFSFHATKLFNTLEGGMVATPKAEDSIRLGYLRNAGIKNECEVVEIGLNGKINEVQAAIGLLNLGAVPQEVAARKSLRALYDDALTGIPGVELQVVQAGVTRSEQYYPIMIDETVCGFSRDDICADLKAVGIHARKYFHPISTDFEPYRNFEIISARKTPYVETLKSRVLCLPFHSGVSGTDVIRVGKTFKQHL